MIETYASVLNKRDALVTTLPPLLPTSAIVLVSNYSVYQRE